MRKHIKIGTRGSLLATTQSTWVKNQIEAQHPEVSVELVIIVTKGCAFSQGGRQGIVR
jgi:hydroxymethylbilane synthase